MGRSETGSSSRAHSAPAGRRHLVAAVGASVLLHVALAAAGTAWLHGRAGVPAALAVTPIVVELTSLSVPPAGAGSLDGEAGRPGSAVGSGPAAAEPDDRHAAPPPLVRPIPPVARTWPQRRVSRAVPARLAPAPLAPAPLAAPSTAAGMVAAPMGAMAPSDVGPVAGGEALDVAGPAAGGRSEVGGWREAGGWSEGGGWRGGGGESGGRGAWGGGLAALGRGIGAGGPSCAAASSLIRERIRARLHYPLAARRRGREGVVEVRFQVDVEGAASGVAVVRSAGEPLDSEAVAAVRRSAPFPPCGAVLSIPVTFRLHAEAAGP